MSSAGHRKTERKRGGGDDMGREEQVSSRRVRSASNGYPHTNTHTNTHPHTRTNTLTHTPASAPPTRTHTHKEWRRLVRALFEKAKQTDTVL